MVPIETRLDAGDLALCSWRDEDAHDLFDAARQSARSVGRWLPWCREDYALADAEAWILHCREGWLADQHYGLAIRSSSTGELLGSVGLSQRNRAHRSANLGYWVLPSKQRQGVMTRASRRVAAFGFQQLALIRIEIVTEVHNLASRRIAESLGARFETVARHRLWSISGAADGAVYGLLPDDLGAL